MTIINPEFKDDLIQIIGNYFPRVEALEFSRNFLIDTEFRKDEISRLSDIDRSQLEFQVKPAKNRFHIDRTITIAKKKLRSEEYSNLLIKLSELCVTHGMMNFAREIVAKISNESRLRNVIAKSLLVNSDIYARRGNWNNSLVEVRKARKIFEEEKDLLGLANCENITGTIYGERGNLIKAKEYFERSLKLAEEVKDKKLTAMLLINLGIIHNIYEDYDAALDHFNDALRKLEEIGDLRRIAEVRHNIGMMYKEQKYYHSALQQFDSAISIAIRNEYHPILAISYISKAEILLGLEEYNFAAAVSEKAMEVAHLLEDKITIAEVYKLQGIINRYLNHYNASENNLLSALRINKKLDIQLNIAECYFELSVLYSELNNTYEEKKNLSMALEYYRKINAQEHIKNIEVRLQNLVN
ncbi:MAG: tetratricopeptide repeat protein [Melioribacteraceae bacterium]|nr:tetratricopeptide repeat protein [Melioribacteraceae bacterium]